jgi:CBS domain-containing protein
MNALSCGHQGNIVPDENKLQPKRGLKRSPSAVFSWPTFITESLTSDVMAPIKSLVQVKATDTIRSVLWCFIKNKVDCVPVYNEATRRYVGFVDMFELVLYIDNAAGDAVIKPDFFQVFKKQAYGDAQITKITSTQSKDHCSSVSELSPLSAVLELTQSANLSRVPVMNKQKVLGTVSQSGIVQYLSQNKSKFRQLASKTIAQLELSGTDNVYTIEENTPSVHAFAYMAEKGVRGLAVVNSEGQFVDAINSFDTKGLVQGDVFSDLRQPVLGYLAKSRILLNKNLAPVICTPEDTLGTILEKMAQERIYRVFVLDPEKRPISVVSLRDILKLMHSYNPEPEDPLPSVGGGALM